MKNMKELITYIKGGNNNIKKKWFQYITQDIFTFETIMAILGIIITVIIFLIYILIN